MQSKQTTRFFLLSGEKTVCAGAAFAHIKCKYSVLFQKPLKKSRKNIPKQWKVVRILLLQLHFNDGGEGIAAVAALEKVAVHIGNCALGLYTSYSLSFVAHCNFVVEVYKAVV